MHIITLGGQYFLYPPVYMMAVSENYLKKQMMKVRKIFSEMK